MRKCDICEKDPVSTLYLRLEYPAGDNAQVWNQDVCSECHDRFRAGLVEWVKKQLRLS